LGPSRNRSYTALIGMSAPGMDSGASAATPIGSRANGAGTGGTGSASSPNPDGHADEVAGVLADAPHPASPTSDLDQYLAPGPFTPA